MENFTNPTFFINPYSAAPPSSSAPPLSLNLMNSQVFGGDFHGGNSKANMLFGSSPEKMMIESKTSSFVGCESEEMVKVGGKGKKGENKKMKKPRYAFQTRSQVDILDDGYRWRKYGQKAVKNNKFPRSYYRCTQTGCNVKKQVQRLAKDEGVVVTTYEGMHSHPIQKSTDNFEHILTQMQIYISSIE